MIAQGPILFNYATFFLYQISVGFTISFIFRSNFQVSKYCVKIVFSPFLFQKREEEEEAEEGGDDEDVSF